MRLLGNFIVLVLVSILIGCVDIGSDLKIHTSQQANPWTHLNLYNNPDNFQFAIVSDRTGEHRPDVFNSAIEKLNLLRPEFVMSVGDLIEGYTDDENELNTQWNEFGAIAGKSQMPFFYVPGNHDISNKVTAKRWHQRLGRSFYHFVYRNVLFLCLNTEDTRESFLSNRQIEYFQRVLKNNRNVRWTLVFMHKPLWQHENNKSWQKFESLLAPRAYTVFAGHEHRYNKSLRNGHRYYVLSTTGGGGSGEDGELLGLKECEFDHIVWVTMTENGPVMANILLEGILDDEPCP